MICHQRLVSLPAIPGLHLTDSFLLEAPLKQSWTEVFITDPWFISYCSGPQH